MSSIKNCIKSCVKKNGVTDPRLMYIRIFLPKYMRSKLKMIKSSVIRKNWTWLLQNSVVKLNPIRKVCYMRKTEKLVIMHYIVDG